MKYFELLLQIEYYYVLIDNIYKTIQIDEQQRRRCVINGNQLKKYIYDNLKTIQTNKTG